MASDLSVPVRRPVAAHTARGIALILLASLFFGSSGAIGKPAMLAGLSPQQVAAARIGLSALILLVGVALFRPSLLRVRRGEWRLLVGYGLLGVAGVQLFYFVAAARVPVGVAILLEFTSPVLIALWVRFIRGVRLPPAMWVGIALAMAGLSMVAQIWAGLRLDAVGVLAGLLAAVCSAAYFLLGEHGVSTRHPLGIVTWGMLIGAVAICIVAPPWTLPVDLLTLPVPFGP
ncbi:MAG: EamA family transporter, partial [Haloechinothrix sp.]